MTSHLLCLTTCPTRNWTCGGRASLGSGLCKVEIKFRDSRIGGWILSLGNFKQEPVQSSHLCPWTWKPPLPDIRPEGPSIQGGPTDIDKRDYGVYLIKYRYRGSVHWVVITSFCLFDAINLKKLKSMTHHDIPHLEVEQPLAPRFPRLNSQPTLPEKGFPSHFPHLFPKLKSTWCESTVQPAGWSHKFCSPLCCPYTAQ